MNYSYRTISKSGESLFKAKGSKHFGYALNAKTEEEIKEELSRIQKEHHTAGHVAYAWRLGADKDRYRANDDGEPSNSAGMPILGQIEKFDLTNVLIAVVRYFGGTKLGVGGLIEAYRTAAQTAIENAEIIERNLQAHYRLSFGYERMSEVMLAIRINNWEASEQDFKQSCKIVISFDPEMKSDFEKAFQPFNDIQKEYLGIY